MYKSWCLRSRRKAQLEKVVASCKALRCMTDMFSFVFMSTAKRSAMTCEHASLRPALQVQCAQRTLLLFSTPTQGCRQVADNFVSGKLWLVLSTNQNEEHWRLTHLQPFHWQRNCMHLNFCKLLGVCTGGCNKIVVDVCILYLRPVLPFHDGVAYWCLMQVGILYST